MNERQQAAFLWQWTQRRKHGALRVVSFGAAIGAAAGLLFAILMLWGMTYDGASFRLNEEEMAPFLLWLGRLLGPTAFLFVVSIPPFALLGAFLAYRVWGLVEGRYHALLDAGARVPDEPPTFSLKDRAPGLIVIAVFVLIALGLFYGLWWEVTTAGSDVSASA